MEYKTKERGEQRMNIFLDAYFWFRGIGCNNEEALKLATKEVKKYENNINSS